MYLVEILLASYAAHRIELLLCPLCARSTKTTPPRAIHTVDPKYPADALRVAKDKVILVTVTVLSGKRIPPPVLKRPTFTTAHKGWSG